MHEHKAAVAAEQFQSDDGILRAKERERERAIAHEIDSRDSSGSTGSVGDGDYRGEVFSL